MQVKCQIGYCFSCFFYKFVHLAAFWLFYNRAILNLISENGG